MSRQDGFTLRRGVLDRESGVDHPWGWLGIFSDAATTGVDGVTVGMARIEPGAENPLHRHVGCAEIVLVLAGAIDHTVGEETVELDPGDMLVVPPGVPHQARSIGPTTAELVVVYNSGEHDFEVVPGD